MFDNSLTTGFRICFLYFLFDWNLIVIGQMNRKKMSRTALWEFADNVDRTDFPSSKPSDKTGSKLSQNNFLKYSQLNKNILNVDGYNNSVYNISEILDGNISIHVEKHVPTLLSMFNVLDKTDIPKNRDFVVGSHKRTFLTIDPGISVNSEHLKPDIRYKTLQSVARQSPQIGAITQQKKLNSPKDSPSFPFTEISQNTLKTLTSLNINEESYRNSEMIREANLFIDNIPVKTEEITQTGTEVSTYDTGNADPSSISMFITKGVGHTTQDSLTRERVSEILDQNPILMDANTASPVISLSSTSTTIRDRTDSSNQGVESVPIVGEEILLVIKSTNYSNHVIENVANFSNHVTGSVANYSNDVTRNGVNYSNDVANVSANYINDVTMYNYGNDVMRNGTNNNNDVKQHRPSHQSVTNLLDNLMLGYDKRLRPDFGGKPLVVKADIEIRSMGPISEKDMIYSMDCYFRQVWTDRRLSFNASHEMVTNVSLNVMMLERIWRPDTIFINGGPSYVHTITTPNKFFRLSHDGTILYSQRLTIKASCPMHLEKFPMDTQQCPLHITSFGYPVSDVIYEWHYGNRRAAVAANDMRLSQFDLQGMPACNITQPFKGTHHSVLTVYFDFRRHTGYFLIQVYLPCCLLVVLSWVSFWINREATADRISLGSLTMLTTTFLVLDTRNDLPRVAYSTALDVYVFMCFCFIFASIVQFAAVHFFTKYGTAESQLLPVSDTDDEDENEDNQFDDSEVSNKYNTHLEAESLAGCLTKMWRCILSTRSNRFNKNVRNALGLNSVSKIDKVARVVFPAAFAGLNIVYWMSYL